MPSANFRPTEGLGGPKPNPFNRRRLYPFIPHAHQEMRLSMRTSLLVFALAGSAFIWTASAQQEMRPTPGPGSGTMTVRGTVDVGNIIDVTASQRGEWKVAVSSVPPMAAASLEFVRKGERYLIAWSAGDPAELVTIAAHGQGGWVQVENPGGRQRWVNLNVARAVEEVR